MSARITKIVSIQPLPEGFTVKDSLPYPYHIEDRQGSVGRQEFWRGDPLRLLGFMESRNARRVDLKVGDFWEAPEKALGMYPVFMASQESGGGISNLRHAVDSVSITIHDAETGETRHDRISGPTTESLGQG